VVCDGVLQLKPPDDIEESDDELTTCGSTQSSQCRNAGGFVCKKRVRTSVGMHRSQERREQPILPQPKIGHTRSKPPNPRQQLPITCKPSPQAQAMRPLTQYAQLNIPPSSTCTHKPSVTPTLWAATVASIQNTRTPRQDGKDLGAQHTAKPCAVIGAGGTSSVLPSSSSAAAAAHPHQGRKGTNGGAGDVCNGCGHLCNAQLEHAGGNFSRSSKFVRSVVQPLTKHRIAAGARDHGRAKGPLPILGGAVNE